MIDKTGDFIVNTTKNELLSLIQNFVWTLAGDGGTPTVQPPDTTAPAAPQQIAPASREHTHFVSAFFPKSGFRSFVNMDTSIHVTPAGGVARAKREGRGARTGVRVEYICIWTSVMHCSVDEKMYRSMSPPLTEICSRSTSAACVCLTPLRLFIGRLDEVVVAAAPLEPIGAPLGSTATLRLKPRSLVLPSVAVQVEVESSKKLKPGFHFIGSRVETRRLSAMGQGESTCTAPPGRTRDATVPPAVK
jgi:hypothetical protein